MSDKTIIVVGDKFEGFGTTPGVVAFSQLRDMIAGRELVPPALVIEGQGLHDEQRDAVRGQLAALGVTFRSVVDQDGCRADAALTHKRIPANILVSVPIRENNTRFVADLLVDDRNEILGDHMTGRHVQGMMLIEAARQMWTAVTERFFLKGAAGSFVIEEVSSRFERFLFPLAARIVYTIAETSSKSTETVFRASCEFMQLASRAAVVETRFRLLQPTLVAKHELLAARAAVRATGAQGG